MTVALAPPPAVSKPQGMGMSWTPWPDRVDEFIVDVLLCIVDDALNVACHVIDELTKPNRVVLSQIVVRRPDCCLQILKKQLDDSRLVNIRDGHL